jgi:hypothetical protein
MNLQWRATAAILLGGFLLAACGGPPQALTEQEIPAAMEKAFESAEPKMKMLADQAVQSVQRKQYAKALLEFQSLCAFPELSKEQRNVASRSMLAVNESLQTAGSEGDKSAENLIRFHQMNK